jgi:hypothetical protein
MITNFDELGSVRFRQFPSFYAVTYQLDFPLVANPLFILNVNLIENAQSFHFEHELQNVNSVILEKVVRIKFPILELIRVQSRQFIASLNFIAVKRYDSEFRSGYFGETIDILQMIVVKFQPLQLGDVHECDSFQ